MVRSSGNINAPDLEADRGLQPSTWTRRLFATRVRFPTPGTGKDTKDEEQDARESLHGYHFKDPREQKAANGLRRCELLDKR